MIWIVVQQSLQPKFVEKIMFYVPMQHDLFALLFFYNFTAIRMDSSRDNAFENLCLKLNQMKRIFFLLNVGNKKT